MDIKQNDLKMLKELTYTYLLRKMFINTEACDVSIINLG
jgi:hypothetical protein